MGPWHNLKTTSHVYGAFEGYMCVVWEIANESDERISKLISFWEKMMQFQISNLQKHYKIVVSSIFCEIFVMRMPHNVTDDHLTLPRVMVWCRKHRLWPNLNSRKRNRYIQCYQLIWDRHWTKTVMCFIFAVVSNNHHILELATCQNWLQ